MMTSKYVTASRYFPESVSYMGRSILSLYYILLLIIHTTSWFENVPPLHDYSLSTSLSCSVSFSIPLTYSSSNSLLTFDLLMNQKGATSRHLSPSTQHRSMERERARDSAEWPAGSAVRKEI